MDCQVPKCPHIFNTSICDGGGRLASCTARTGEMY